MKLGRRNKTMTTILHIIDLRRKQHGKHHQQVESHQKPDRQCSAFSFHNPGQTIWNSPQRTQYSETTTKTFYHSVASHNQTALTAENAESAEEGKSSLCVFDLALFLFPQDFRYAKAGLGRGKAA